MGKRIKRLEAIEIVHPHAGGLDIGSREIWAAVPPGREGETVRVFGSFTPDLHRLADWLIACGVDTVAMESTGGVLDCGVRDTGSTRVESLLGQCATHQERTRTEE